MKELVGKKVLAIYVDSEEQHFLKFEVEGCDPIVYAAIGDCCSESWFYHVLGVDCLINQTVQSENSDEMDRDEIEEDDGLIRQERDLLYKITLTTERGYCDIEFRNSSNGYYGGEIILHEHGDFDYNYRFGKGYTDPIKWEQIQTDWTHGLKE